MNKTKHKNIVFYCILGINVYNIDYWSSKLKKVDKLKITTVANQKGGVGKTSTATHLAFFVRDFVKDKKILFIDLDPQGNSTKTMLKSGAESLGKASTLYNESMEVPKETNTAISLYEADGSLADLERADFQVIGHFKENLEALSSQYDYCVIDTPPSLGLKMTSAVLASTHVLSPIQLEEYAIDGIAKMLKTIFGIKDKWNPSLEFIGMLPNLFNVRSKEQKALFNELLANYSDMVIPQVVGIRTSIPNTLTNGQAVWEVKNNTGAKDATKEMKASLEIIFDRIEGANNG